MSIIKQLFSFWILCMIAQSALSQMAKNNSLGSLSFKCNGIVYKADSTHARAYAVKQTGHAFLNGANTDNMIITLEWNGYTNIGKYILRSENGKAGVTINNKTYTLRQASDYFKIEVRQSKLNGSFLLLTGVFEGQLHDKIGNEIKITNGQIETFKL